MVLRYGSARVDRSPVLRLRWPAAALAFALLLAAGTASAQEQAGTAVVTDPRIGLAAGWLDAGEAASNMDLIAHRPRPAGFFNPDNPGDSNFSNTDLACRGSLAFQGNYHGFKVYDIADPSNPTLRVAVVCPGGQGDLSVYGDLLFMSVEQTRGRVDCGVEGVSLPVSPERFRGVRIFDISDVDNPRQVAAVQTCRGSHTHSLLADPRDPENVYVYVSGTSVVRPGEELPGCSGLPPDADPRTALFRIEVIRVPLAAPQDARVVSEPRIFADRETGAIAGLWPGGTHGPDTQRSSQTNQCHDITTYPAIGLAAGACSGNGILLDISDPVNPRRIEEVVDPNFAYWHSATFSNDGRKVIFTDEWGGGSAARCRETDLPEWGANAIFDVVDGRLRLASYYKLPVPQTATENCVAHNGSLIPVPGRDIKVQAWYQGGISVFDFTDSANPVEIAFFDRGPLSDSVLMTGGYWSAYWYNGHIYGAEIARGFDVFRLTPSEHLTQNEIEAARLVRYEEFNPQHQPQVTWPASFTVARAYLDQLVRSGGIAAEEALRLANDFDRIERLPAGAARRAALAQLAAFGDRLDGGAAAAAAADAERMRLLAAMLRALEQNER
jgi:hypothetical protein